jgi:ABC-type dipeptide/oligopeptide/nickel transport system permease subunit
MVRGPVEPFGVDAPADGIAARSPTQLFWARFRRNRIALAALAFIVVLIVAALAAPLITSLTGAPGPNEQDTSALDPVFGAPTGPSSSHPLGVDTSGHDLFSRILYGARVSLAVALISTLLAMVAGVAAGTVAGYYRGWTDAVISRLVDVVLTVPILLLAVGIGSACTLGCVGGALRPGLGVVIFVIFVANWTYIARIMRGQVLSLREREFVEASRSLGASDRRIIVREILPNLVAPIVVYSTLLIPQAILFEAALSFLGVGVPPTTPTWGAMLGDATPDSAWWYVVFPGMALLLTVMAFNLLGDGLQDALDPRRKA